MARILKLSIYLSKFDRSPFQDLNITFKILYEDIKIFKQLKQALKGLN